jgi:hypothetical protein
MFVVNPDQRTNTTQQSILILSEKMIWFTRKITWRLKENIYKFGRTNSEKNNWQFGQ